jgi:hypothetical protein
LHFCFLSWELGLNGAAISRRKQCGSPWGESAAGEILPERFPGWQDIFAGCFQENEGFPGLTEPSFAANKPLSAPNKPSCGVNKALFGATKDSATLSKPWFTPDRVSETTN